MNTTTKAIKPLGQRAYGSIPHLPGSRRGPADIGLDPQQARILTEKTRDAHDLVTVQEKLDGSCVAVAKVCGEIVPLIRAGYRADQSNWEQHHHFARWVEVNRARFNSLLREDERCCGEWLMEAHGTIYDLPHEPFVIFDLMQKHDRALASEVANRCAELGFTTPRVLHRGGALSIDAVLPMLETSGHGAKDGVEGAVWRIERQGKVDFLGKYVRPDKVDGKYLKEVSGANTVYNWKPDDTPTPRTDERTFSIKVVRALPDLKRTLFEDLTGDKYVSSDFARQLEREIPKWQPIATAPKDGTKILIYDKLLGIVIASWVIECCWLSAGCGWFVEGHRSDTVEALDATHWMSPPEPPSEAA